LIYGHLFLGYCWQRSCIGRGRLGLVCEGGHDWQARPNRSLSQETMTKLRKQSEIKLTPGHVLCTLLECVSANRTFYADNPTFSQFVKLKFVF
jgi:hypothetical protein